MIKTLNNDKENLKNLQEKEDTEYFKSSKDNIIESDETREKNKKDVFVDIPITDFILLPEYNNKNQINKCKIIWFDILNITIPITIIVGTLLFVVYIIYLI